MRAVATAIVMAAGMLAGCSALLPSPSVVPIDALPVGEQVVTPQAQLRLSAINQTTIPVKLVVNGTARDMAAGASVDLGVADLGPLPWDLRFTTAADRVLLAGTLHDGDVWRQNDGGGQGESGGFLVRADLSCGLLILVAGDFGSWGPAPGPGEPGDCD